MLDRVQLKGTERALDLGCGTGRLTALLAERLPHGDVVGLDRSRSMLTTAGDWLQTHAPRVRLVMADGAALPFVQAFDAGVQCRHVPLDSRSRSAFPVDRDCAAARWPPARAVRRQRQSCSALRPRRSPDARARVAGRPQRLVQSGLFRERRAHSTKARGRRSRRRGCRPRGGADASRWAPTVPRNSPPRCVCDII